MTGEQATLSRLLETRINEEIRKKGELVTFEMNHSHASLNISIRLPVPTDKTPGYRMTVVLKGENVLPIFSYRIIAGLLKSIAQMGVEESSLEVALENGQKFLLKHEHPEEFSPPIRHFKYHFYSLRDRENATEHTDKLADIARAVYGLKFSCKKYDPEKSTPLSRSNTSMEGKFTHEITTKEELVEGRRYKVIFGDILQQGGVIDLKQFVGAFKNSELLMSYVNLTASQGALYSITIQTNPNSHEGFQGIPYIKIEDYRGNNLGALRTNINAVWATYQSITGMPLETVERRMAESMINGQFKTSLTQVNQSFISGQFLKPN